MLFDGYTLQMCQLFPQIVHWHPPSPRMPVANEGFGKGFHGRSKISCHPVLVVANTLVTLRPKLWVPELLCIGKSRNVQLRSVPVLWYSPLAEQSEACLKNATKRGASHRTLAKNPKLHIGFLPSFCSSSNPRYVWPQGFSRAGADGDDSIVDCKVASVDAISSCCLGLPCTETTRTGGGVGKIWVKDKGNCLCCAYHSCFV